MGRSPSCSQDGLTKGAWTAFEDTILRDYIKAHGEGKWSNVCRKTGLKRCGKSCRLRWMNYLRPDIKRGNISHDEEELIIRLHKLLGNRWSLIAGRLPGRTDNEIKNYWNTNLAKRAKDITLSVSRATDDDEVPQNLDTRNKFTCEGVLVEAAAQSSEQNQDNKCIAEEPSPSPVTHMSKNVTVKYELRNELPLSMSKGDRDTDFMMDFNVEDICKFLDTSDIEHMESNGGEDSPFLEKLEGADMTSSDFLSLASSFLESAEEEWPGDDLKINVQPNSTK